MALAVEYICGRHKTWGELSEYSNERVIIILQTTEGALEKKNVCYPNQSIAATCAPDLVSSHGTCFLRGIDRSGTAADLSVIGDNLSQQP